MSRGHGWDIRPLLRNTRWRGSIVVFVVAALLALASPSATAGPTPAGTSHDGGGPCQAHPSDTHTATEAVPGDLEAAIEAALGDERLVGVGMGLSLWIEGYGEIGSVNPDLRLLPASNQKILTAMGALEYLGSETVTETRVVATGTVTEGVLDGDLYLIGGGDPTLATEGDHSLDTLAREVREAGILHVEGDVVADESRYDRLRTVGGWRGMPIPRWVGSLSALMVDQNRGRSDWDFIAEPALANGHRFAGALAAHRVARRGEVRLGTAPEDATAIVKLISPPVIDLVRVILEDSDNTVAEMLVKEIGLAANGIGSTASGMAALEELSQALCARPSILQHDGSGLSRGNARSAGDWRHLLQAAQSKAWWPEMEASMAVAGETGTLAHRFLETPVAGSLRAKTGSIVGVRALSGLMTTTGGRAVAFSAMVHADEPRPPMAAIDDLLIAVATDES